MLKILDHTQHPGPIPVLHTRYLEKRAIKIAAKAAAAAAAGGGE